MKLHSVLAFTTLASALAAALAQEPATTAFLDQVEVRVISVDVVVFDRDGHRVTGLERDDFEVLEDGKPVEITNFSAYAGRVTRPDVAPIASAGEDAAAVVAEESLPPTVTWAFYVDQTRLELGPRNAVLRDFAAFAASSVRSRDRALAATYDGLSLKVLSPLGPPGDTVAALAEAQKHLAQPTPQVSQSHFIRNQIAAVNTASRDAAVEAAGLLDAIDALVEEESARGRASMQAFADMFAILSGLEGRVALVVVSGGYDTSPGAPLFRFWQEKFGALGIQNQFNEFDRRWSEARRDYDRLLSAASRGRITVYSVQAGQNRGPDVTADMPGQIGFDAPASGADAGSLSQGSSIAAFALATGGRTFSFGGDLTRRLEAARADLDSYYSLGYDPPTESSDRRKVEVRIRRAGLKALHRVSVDEASWRERTGDLAVTALLADPVPDPFLNAEIEVGAAAEKKGRGRSRLVPVTVSLPLRGVTLLPGAAAHRGKLYFQLAVRDPDGGYRRLEGRPFEFEVPNERLSTALGQQVSFRFELKFDPGSYRVSAAILDELGGQTEVATAPVVLAAVK